MNTVKSADGTTIAYDKFGTGSAVIVVGGALEQRAWASETTQIAQKLGENFSVYFYDRRGRGDSTDTQPFALEREIEDIEALINEAGGSASLFGLSSGAALAFEAALQLGGKVEKLAMYEPPYNSDESARAAWRKYRTDLNAALAENRKGDALGHFMMLVGMSAEDLEGMRHFELWPQWEAIEHTLVYDAEALGEEADVPIEKAARLTVPTLVMDGSASFPFMHPTAVMLAEVMPQGYHRTLEGQTHEVSAEVITPILTEFFNS
jgi:pimeloyl-ACP methyl ester carboxylesterase